MIKQAFTSETTAQRLQEQRKDRMELFLPADGQLRGAILHGTRFPDN